MASIDASAPSVTQRPSANQYRLSVDDSISRVSQVHFTSRIVQTTTKPHSLATALTPELDSVSQGFEKAVKTVKMVVVSEIFALVVAVFLIYAGSVSQFSTRVLKHINHAVGSIGCMRFNSEHFRSVACIKGRFTWGLAVATEDFIADNTIMPIGNYLREKYPTARLLLELVDYYLRPIVFPDSIRPLFVVTELSSSAQASPSGSAHVSNAPANGDEIALQACARVEAQHDAERLQWMNKADELMRNKGELEDKIIKLKNDLTTTKSELHSVLEREAKLQRGMSRAVMSGCCHDPHSYHTGLSNSRTAFRNSENELRLLAERMAKAEPNDVVEELRNTIRRLDSEFRSASAKFARQDQKAADRIRVLEHDNRVLWRQNIKDDFTVARLTAEISDAKQQDWQPRFEALEQDKSALQQQLESAELKKGDIETELAESKMVNEGLQVQLEGFDGDFSNKLRSAKEENETLKGRLHSAETQLKQVVENTRRELAAELDTAVTEKKNLGEKLAEMQNTIQGQRKQLQLYADKEKQNTSTSVLMPPPSFTPMQGVSYYDRGTADQQPSIKLSATSNIAATQSSGLEPLDGQKPLPAFNAAALATGFIKQPGALAGVVFANTQNISQGNNVQSDTATAAPSMPHLPSQSVTASSAGSFIARTATRPFNPLIDDSPMEDVFEHSSDTANTIGFTTTAPHVTGVSSCHADIAMGDASYSQESRSTNAQHRSHPMRPSNVQYVSLQYPQHTDVSLPQSHRTNSSNSFQLLNASGGFTTLSRTDPATPHSNGPTTYNSHNGAGLSPSTSFSSSSRDHGFAQPGVLSLPQSTPYQTGSTTKPPPQQPQLEPPGWHALCWCTKGSKRHAPYCTYALEAMNGWQA